MPTHSKKFLIGQRFIFDPNDNSLIDKLESNELIRLGSNESRALSLLIEDPSLIITRQRIHDYVWREQGFEVDDSSLTQAISTLRKALKDSTKSPAFVKTVPKRGYQIIATVETYVNEEDTDYNNVPQETLAHPEHIPPIDTQSIDVKDSELVEQITDPEPSIPPSIETKPKVTWFGWIALIIALILPIAVNLSMPPKSAAFRPLLQVEGVKIYTPISNPVMKNWNNMISSCVSDYLKNHQDEGKPTEVIVTGGQNNQLYLNYLHSSSVPMENVTLRLLTSHEDNVKLCQ
ncbi:transcription activator ToxR [Photobacterium sp. SKA34]|uniref:transcriptional regulator n=1 Tax=Photobacterium sp. SKA34 TaxID=121723 RepID=UPI00006AEE38|nr:transcriptional regulator [Photobacterium sp. SKA34]EAR56233.1 transcription activator ToxR [Photobacterium sp. SKA34]